MADWPDPRVLVMTPDEYADEAVSAALEHLYDRFGEGIDQLEALLSIAHSFSLMSEFPERYIARPELMPRLMDRVLIRIQLERDRRAGAVH